jgi:hypothetical protein
MNMEGHELLGKMNRAKAPTEFETRVLARLGEERQARVRRRTTLRYALAGAAGVVVIGFLALNTLVLQKKPAETLAAKSGSAERSMAFGGSVQDAAANNLSLPAAGRAREDISRTALPVLEAVDYSREVRSVSYEPQTVYILEQVSDVRPSEIKY